LQSLRDIQEIDGESIVEIEASPGVAALSLTNNAGTGPASLYIIEYPAGQDWAELAPTASNATNAGISCA